MSTTTLKIRTEDIKPEEILDLYVETTYDARIVELLKGPAPTILEGSRGTGKSFLMRVAEAHLARDFASSRVLPVYVSFARSSLLQTGDPRQFTHWMMSKLCARMVRALYQNGLLARADPNIALLSGGVSSLGAAETTLEKTAKQYEESYRTPGIQVDSSAIPDVEQFKDTIEDLCRDLNVARFAVFFDEAAHIFRPEQQRQFFTLFRDLRSPYFSCNAAVYPGVTFFGQTFQVTHDATLVTLSRDPLDPQYLANMREMVVKQAESELVAEIERRRENFHSLAYAVSGNPRLLMKTVQLCKDMSSTEVKRVLKEFYRTDVWSEHSGLAERYAGHRAFIDWGRDFIERVVIPESNRKNEQWQTEAKTESTCCFWIHRDVPAAINEALRLLSYTGMVTRLDSGIVATRAEIGTRYSINLGCLVAASPDPIATLTRLGQTLTIKRFTEFGVNHPAFSSLTSIVGNFEEKDLSLVLERELAKQIQVLDLTDYQKQGLQSIGLTTVGQALQASETDFQKIYYVGPVRSRQMMNIVVASVLEYLSG
jgi:hypothetical protein